MDGVTHNKIVNISKEYEDDAYMYDLWFIKKLTYIQHGIKLESNTTLHPGLFAIETELAQNASQKCVHNFRLDPVVFVIPLYTVKHELHMCRTTRPSDLRNTFI